MCGRFVRTSQREVIAVEFSVTEFVTVDLRPRYNIAPSQDVEAIIRDGSIRRLGSMRWGFAAPATTSSLAPINARAESVATSPLFREAFRRRRCLVVADGFYEWRRDGKQKTPYFIHLRSNRPFGFAGIWTAQRTEAGMRRATCAILTCPPNEVMAPIHDRMPVILPPAARELWLDPHANTGELRAILAPLPSTELETYPVSTLVSSPCNDVPECVQRSEQVLSLVRDR